MNNPPNPYSRPPNFHNGQQGIMNPTNFGFGSGQNPQQPQQMNFYNHPPMNMNGFNNNNNGSMQSGRMPYPNNQFNPQSFRNNNKGFRGNRPVNNIWSSHGQSPQPVQPHQAHVPHFSHQQQQQHCHQAQGNFPRARHLNPGQFDPSRNQGQFDPSRNPGQFDPSRNPGQFDASRNPYENKSFNSNRGQFKAQNKGPQPNKKNKKNNKDKVDKRDLAENNMFYCDICDRGFKRDDIYTKHVGEHQQCKVEGCPYVAAPKLVRLHFDLQHRTGFAKKIWCTESKEELDAWINERKRKYPTASNILKKKMEVEEKQSRGEVLETKQFGKMRDRKKNRGRNRNNNFKRKAEDEGEKEIIEKKIKTSPKKESDPLGMLIQSDPECEDSMVCEPTNALAAILTCYADSDDGKSDTEDDNITKVADTKKTKMENDNVLEAEKTEIIDDKKNTRRNKDGEMNDNNNNNNKSKVVKNNQNTKPNNEHNPYNKQSLLEMLLAKEIRHERNVILQCVHYIVKKNFFSKEDDERQNSDTR